jgi:N-acyl-D-amino-acid deacylase
MEVGFLLDILLKDMKIVDGTGSPWFNGDIGIVGEEIVAIKHRIDIEAKKVIDGKGLVACPGFIDMHTHSDLLVFKYPQEETKLRQGITTALLGQDGLSVAPIDDQNVSLMQKRLLGLLGRYVDKWTWRTMGEYLAELDKVNPASNNLMLVPHSNVRAMVVGWDARPATDQEIEQMKEIVNQAFHEGACGFSTGLIYPPGMYADKREFVELLRVTADNGGFFVVHMRSESDRIRDSIAEVAGYCREAGCPLHISHLKVAGKSNWGRSAEVLSLIDQARADGLDVTFDQYPYTAGSTMLDMMIPPWYHEGGTEKMLAKLRDQKIRAQLHKDHETPSTKWENRAITNGWDSILITAVQSEKNKYAEGKNIAELAQITGKTPTNVVADLLIEEDGAVTMANFHSDEKDVERIMQHQCICVCSDGIVGGKPHPRVYGTFPRILGKYVREQGIMTMEAAIQKMTANPARRLNLQDRGILREGMKADITIFDPETIIDLGTYKEPNQFPVGVEHVLVNGQLSLNAGKLTGVRAGRVIKSKI